MVIGFQSPSSVVLSKRMAVYLYQPRAKMTTYFSMTLETDPASRMSCDFQVDDGTVGTHYLLSGKKGKLLAEGWREAVTNAIINGVWKRDHGVSITTGEHTVPVRSNHSNLVLEKIILGLVGIWKCYRGPPPSVCIIGQTFYNG